MEFDDRFRRPGSAPALLSNDSAMEEVKRVLRDSGGSEEFVASFTRLLQQERKETVLNRLISHVANNSDQLMSKRVEAMDVQVVSTTRQDIKDDVTSHFEGYRIKFKDAAVTHMDTRSASNLNEKFDLHRTRTRPVKPYAITQHPKSHVMRQVLEAILVRHMDIGERFLTFGMMYENFMRRGLNCHCCFQLLETERTSSGDLKEVPGAPLPGAWSRISRAEASLRKHVRTLLRENPKKLNSVLSEFSYSNEEEPYYYENTGLRYRCFRPPELCKERARQAITMLSAKDYSLDSMVRIMHSKGVEILYGAEAMSKSMLRFNSGSLHMFEQDYVIDLERDEMRVYNKDEANDYVYKYSQFRQFFFEQDIVHDGYVYAFRHEYTTSDVLIYAIRRLPLGTKPVKHSPVVDIRDDFVFLKTYLVGKTWNRHSGSKVQPMIISCHRVIFNQVKNHLVSIEKPDDEYLITTKRYLRTLNSEFVVNGITYRGFQKLPAEHMDQVAVALLMEAIKEKLATNTLVEKVFKETKSAFERRSTPVFALEAFYKHITDLFTKRVPMGELIDLFTECILGAVKDNIWSSEMVVEFFSFSHFIDNPYSGDALGAYANVPLTPYETMWFYHDRNGSIADVSWFEDLLKYDPEPDFSIIEDAVNGINLDSLFAPEDDSDANDSDSVDDDEVMDFMDEFTNDVRERQPSIALRDNEENIQLEERGLSEVPELLKISDVNLPVLRPEEVTDAKTFKQKVRSSASLRTANYANAIAFDEDSSTDHEKAIFEAYVYRKDSAACTHNVMCREAMTSFFGEDNAIVKKNIDSQQKKKAGFNVFSFSNGKEVSRYYNTDKKYSVGYLPYSDNNIRSCYQLIYNVVAKRHEIKNSSGLYSGPLLVSDLTVVMNDENIAWSLATYDRNFVWPEMVLVSAGAGCGKTHFTVHNFSPNNFYIGSTRKVVHDLREKLKEVHKENFPNFDFDMRVRTCDSLTVNGLRKLYVQDLYIDECYQSHVGELLRVIQLVNPERVIYLGDPVQIRFIDRLAIRDLIWSTNLEHFISRKITLNVTRRCPQDVTRLLSDRFYENNPLFGEKFLTTSAVRYSMEYKIIHSENEINLYDDVLYLTFTKADAFQLNEYFKKCGRGEKLNAKSPKVEVVDGDMVRTVHTGQGMDVDNVILVRLTKNIDVDPLSPAHQLVAMSRHKRYFKYMTVLDDDVIVEHIRYAKNTMANLQDYVISVELANSISKEI